MLVIGLFAKLIGLGDLAKRVQKIFKKIRKRVDKVVRDLLKKAKRAGRKLMRKLGIGKKKKGGKDERSKKEMEADLKAAKTRAQKLLENPDKSPEEVKKELPKIKKDFDLSEVKLVKDKGEKYHVYLKVNPDTETPSRELGAGDLPKYKLPSFGSSKAGSFDAILTSEVPMGQESTAQKGNWPAWNAVRDGKADGTYVRTHLLHHELGGKATISNLTPTKTGLNTRFYNAVEKFAVSDKNEFPIWYRVNISYHSEVNFTDYISKINASYGRYELKNGKWQYGKTIKKFKEDNPKPVFGDRVYNLNNDGAVSLSSAGLDFNFASLIVRERKENGNFLKFSNFEDRMEDRNDQERVRISNFSSQMLIIKDLYKESKITI